MSITYRVAARYKMSVFIPDKIWRDGKARAKATMAVTLTDRTTSGLRFELTDRFRVVYQKFIQQLKDFGLPPELELSLDFRLDTVLAIIQKIADSAFEFQKQYADLLYKDTPTVLERLESAIAEEITDYYSDSIVRIGDGLKATWHTDRNLIKALAQRILKKASPEEQRAVEEASTLLTTRAIDTKYKFFDRVNLKGLSRKLVTKQKIDYDFLRWFDFLRDVVSVNYSTGNKDRQFRNFDLHGMKIVINDSTVTDTDIKLYIRYLDETHAKMKAKGFESAWYGTVLIECDNCGGVNYNTGGGTGGNYTIGTDVVRVFSRPTRFIVELVSHELGHRYWFRQMTETQRERFKALIRVNPQGRRRPDKSLVPVNLLPPAKVQGAHHKVDEVTKKVQDLLLAFKSSRLRWHRKVIDLFEPQLSQAAHVFWNEMLDAVHSAGADSTISHEVQAAFKDVLSANDAVQKYLRVWTRR